MTSLAEPAWRLFLPSRPPEQDPTFRSVLSNVLHTGLRQCGTIGLIGTVLYVGLSVLGFGFELHWTYRAFLAAGRESQVVVVGVLIVAALSVFSLVLAETECSLQAGRLFGLVGVLLTTAVAAFEGALRGTFNTEYVMAAYLLIVAIIPFYPPEVLGIGGAAGVVLYFLGPEGLAWGGPAVPSVSMATHLAFVGGTSVLVTGASVVLYRRHRAFGQKEAELRKSRDLLRRTQEVGQIGQVGGWEYLPESGLVQGTGQLCRLLGRGAGTDLDLETWLSFYPSESRQKVRAALERALETGDSFDLEVRFTPADGETRWGRIRGQAHRQDDRTVRLSGTLQDITKLKSRERVLREERDRFETLFESLPTPVIRCTAEEEGILIADANGAFEKVFGIELSAAEGKDIDALLRPVGEQGEPAEINDCDLEKETRQMEVQYETANGERDFQLQVASRKRQEGPPEVYAIYTDITERREAEVELREARNYYEQVLNQVPIDLAVFDPGARYEYVNAHGISDPELRRWILGHTNEEYCLKRGIDLAFGQRRDEAIREAARTGERVELDETLETDEGPRHYFRVHSPVTDLEGQVTKVAAFGFDITERKRRKEELRKAKEEAEEAAQLKSAMMANMSHEVRTPLTSVTGFAEILKGELEGRLGEFASRIHRSGQRLMKTLDSILELSKLEAGAYEVEREQARLEEVVARTMELLRPKAEVKSLTFEMSARGGPVEGRFDVGALNRTAENLIENAIKFTPEGGRVDVRVRENGEVAIFEVEDTGIGMDPEKVDELFGAFKQESEGHDRDYEGTGLGLSIVRRFTEAHGGTVTVDTEKGEGTCFTVRLPLRTNGETVQVQSGRAGQIASDLDHSERQDGPADRDLSTERSWEIWGDRTLFPNLLPLPSR